MYGKTYHILTELTFHTAKYQDRGLIVLTKIERSVRKDQALNILPYEKQTRLICMPQLISTKRLIIYRETSENMPSKCFSGI